MTRFKKRDSSNFLSFKRNRFNTFKMSTSFSSEFGFNTQFFILLPNPHLPPPPSPIALPVFTNDDDDSAMQPAYSLSSRSSTAVSPSSSWTNSPRVDLADVEPYRFGDEAQPQLHHISAEH
jgi:hypothetical protein